MARRKRTQAKASAIQDTIVKDPLRDFKGGRIEYYLFQIFSTVGRNKKESITILITVIVLAIFGSIYWSQQIEQEQKSIAAFEQLKREPIMQTGSGAEEKAFQKLDKYEKEFSSTKSKLRSNIKRLELYTAKGGSAAGAAIANQIADTLDYPEQRALFYLKAAIILENETKYPAALKAYRNVVDLIKKDDYLKAFALFGEGRCLIRSGRKKEGHGKIIEMMKMKEAEQISELRLQAVSFLLMMR